MGMYMKIYIPRNGTLLQKLGIKEGFKIGIINPPKNYPERLGRLPNNVEVSGD